MNRTFRIASQIAASIFCLAGAVSLAQAHEGAIDPGCADKRAAFHQKKLERFDTDKDGKLSEAERAQMHEQRRKMHDQHRAETLTHHDANKDGVLDESERGALRAEHVQRLFTRLDANADGQLTREEAKCGPLARRFDAVDLDKSGTLSKEEVGKVRLMHHRGPHSA